MRNCHFLFQDFHPKYAYQRRLYSQCQPLNIVVSSANTSSYTIQWHNDAVNCNESCTVWACWAIFKAASMKISKKCHSLTSFSTNKDRINMLPLANLFSIAIRIQSFTFQRPTASDVCIIATLPRIVSIQTSKSNTITAKEQDPAIQCIPNCSMLLYQPKQQTQCLLSLMNQSAFLLLPPLSFSRKVCPST